jgi:hypothetical protein
MKAPVDTSNPNNMAGILINNLVKEEDIARQRSPLDSNIFAKLLQSRTYLARRIQNSSPYLTWLP